MHNTHAAVTTSSGAGGDWIRIADEDLGRHKLSGAIFISRAALANLSGNGPTLYDVLDWLGTSAESMEVGDTCAIAPGLEAHFGFDDLRPNGECFFVQIDVGQAGRVHG